ncbi:hypothetical protein BKA58DRAFT_435777 [Alternaria rosae]|uniref:uncharacterized protein n=1 Tax=Alternaria rosae TaxID=1187941 RepID=UPI001E8E4A4F|nr:uncharacterized protein BKA58DRAFT_435777 [Alternaria rosae]KAH6878064.1 hypothetical protein BKA58DRAFT_435777 [Alternaria rosae]
MADFNDTIEESSANAWAWNSNVDNNMLAPDPFGLPGLSLSDVNWLSPQYSGPVDLDALLANFGGQANGTVEQWTCSIAAITPSIPAITTTSHLSDPGRNVPDIDRQSKDTVSVVSTSTSENRYYVDGAGARAPFGGKSQHSICSEETIDLQDAEANDASAPLHASDEDTLCPSAAYQSLLEGIAAESRHSLVEMSALNFPTYGQVVTSVRQYFDTFHQVFPFLRRSSFAQYASESWLLLLAVSVIGSRYSQLSQHSRISDQFSGLLRAIITRCKYGLDSQSSAGNEDVDYSPSPTHSIARPDLKVVQAGILNIACMLHSGKKVLVERAHVERHYLVEVCHALSLLAQTKKSYDLTRAADPGQNPDLREWLSREAMIRTGMMVWTLDTMFVYEFQAKPLIQFDDIDAVLPCHEDIWEQPGLIRQNQRRLSSVTFMEALEMVYVEKRLPVDLGEFSMGLLVSAICRHTRDVVARDRIRLNSWTPTSTPQRRSDMPPPIHQDWLPTTRSSIKWRNSACDSLDVLHWPANSKVARHSGFEHHTILQLHLARLIILAPTSAIQRFASGSASNEVALVDEEDGHSFATARIQVLQWVIRDHCKARLCLVHCGALFWHVRRYSRSSLFEPYAIYIATLILWAFCVCMHLPEAIEAIASESDEEPEPSFLHLDRPLDDELVQTYVRMGHKMSAYIANVGSLELEAAPVRIAKEGISILAKRSGFSSNPDDNPSSSSQDASHTWGIERSYINLLRLLTKER